MRIETTRSAAAVRLRHAAAFHGSPDDLLAQLVPLVTAALERGEPVAAAVTERTEEALRERIGRPAGLILLGQPYGPDSGSGQTVAARRARQLREIAASSALGPGGRVTAVSEHTSRLDGLDGAFWTELDAAANVAMAELPLTLTCFFPELPLHVAILDGARGNHPFLLDGGELRHNPAHRDPRAVLVERPAPAPVLLGPPDHRLTFSAWQLHEVRAVLEGALLAAGYERARAEDVALAVNEVATNAVEHGSPQAELALWAAGDGIVCEVHDRGRLRDPLPGLQAPHPSDARGRGLWIARQICETLHVWADASGTHVRIRAAP
ncbi:ATP-binding protein [Pseudonocardia nigra]|uniref:ATP-binding protein n=1 Tax=Pseudonocardia nigra TaxID=1921578 RepID=UPI001C5DFA82|nr:ATP-binding protein [Pseudonocardia nigra]